MIRKLFLGLLMRRDSRAKTLEHQQRLADDIKLLNAVERDAIVMSHLNKCLSPLGLVQIAPRSWIDGSAPPAKRMFEMSLLKGAGIRANWGFSLDFVPHISGSNSKRVSGRRVCWHRTDKSAMLDVIVDPRDHTQFSFLFGATRLNTDLELYLPIAVERARETWRRGETWHGMLEIVQELRQQETNCFGFYNYTQLPLAFAFLSAKTGNLDAALDEIETYAHKNQLPDELKAKLVKFAEDLGVPT